MRVLLVLLALFPSLVFAQKISELEIGEQNFGKKDYRKALYHLKKYLLTDTTNAKAYLMRAQCYVELFQLDSAFHDFEKVLRLDPSEKLALRGVAYVYDQKEDTVHALEAWENYVEVAPDDADALFRLGSWKLDAGFEEEGRVLIDQSYQLDSLQPATTYFKSMFAYYDGNMAEVVRLCRQGLTFDPQDSQFRLLCSMALYYLGDFSASAKELDTVLMVELDPEVAILKAKAEVLSVTPQKNIILPDTLTGNAHFVGINQTNLASLDSWSKNPSHIYSYEKLKEKLASGEPLGADEYFMLYFGFSNTPAYAPYEPSGMEERVESWLENNDFASIIRFADSVLAINPTQIDLYYVKATAFLGLDRWEDFYTSIKHYEGFITGILATGKGLSFDDPILVTSVHSEYIILGYLGYPYTETQSLESVGEHHYDLIQAQDDEGGRRVFYFNIDKPFSSLSILPDEKKSKKSKKTKN